MPTASPLSEILGVSYRDDNGVVQHNPDRPQVTPEQLDEMPWATEIYARDLDVTKYNVPSCCIRLSRSTPPAAARRSVPSACGRRR